MLKPIMENQGNETNVPQPDPDSQNTNAQDPAVVPVQPAQPIEQSAPTPPANLPVAPPATVTAVEPSSPSSDNVPNAGPASPSIPTEWPGAFKAYKPSKTVVSANMSTIATLIAIMIGSYIVYFIILIATKKIISRYVVELLYQLVEVMVFGALTYALIQGVKGNKPTTSEAYSVAVKRWVHLILAALLVDIITLVSLVLLIVPFFFVFPRVLFTSYYILDQNMGPVQALKTSWAQTKGNVGKVYGLIGVFILIAIPSITIIGVIATVYFLVMYAAASPMLYLYMVNKHSNAPLAPSTTPSVSPAPPPAAA